MAVPRPLRSRVAPQAFWITALLAALSFAALALGFDFVAVVAGLLAIANLLFFRNPNRRVPEGEHLALAPADGRVMEVAPVDDAFVGSAIRVAIFLSVFDVHVNRAPLSGKIRALRRSGARFVAAFDPRASELNVQLRLDVETGSGVRMGLVQITGLIARRIVCYPEEGGELVRGEPYGLMCYGSRMEIYLPASATLRVEAGQRVRAGESVIAELAAG